MYFLFSYIIVTQRAALNLPPLQTESRHKSDIKAKTTIAITIAAYFICFAPSIPYAARGRREESQIEKWLAFLVWFGVSLSSAVNPMNYYLRTNRFRSALKQLIKDPFGSSEFKEESRVKKPKSHQKAWQNKECNEAREQNGHALVPKDQTQKPCEGKVEEREEGGVELFKEKADDKEVKKTRAIFIWKENSAAKDEEAGHKWGRAQEGRDDSAHCSHGKTKCEISAGKQRNAVANGQGVCNVMKKARGEDENERE